MAYTNEVKAAFLPSNMGAFGDLIAQPLDPVIQLGFEYGLNSQHGTTADGGVTITNGESIASIDTAGTTITGGTILFNASFARNSNLLIELHTMDLFLEPGGTMTFAFTGDSAGTVRVAVNWLEDT